jgi:hypothetical protein
MTPKEEWSVPWPDGSWLTWNDETESWEKQEGPPPAGEAKATQPPTAKPAKKSAAAKTPAKKAAPAARKRPEPAPAPARPPVRLDLDDTSPVETTTSSAWRPITARPERAVEPIPPTPAPRPVEPPRRPTKVTRSRDLSLLPVIGAGCIAGVAAGYLLHFLIR